MGVVTLVSTFSFFQVIKSILPTTTTQSPAMIEQQATVTTKPVVKQEELPKLVVIKPRHSQEKPEAMQASRLGKSHPVDQDGPISIDIEKLSNQYFVSESLTENTDISIDFAEANTEQAQPAVQAADEKLHSDIEAFLIQKQ